MSPAACKVLNIGSPQLSNGGVGKELLDLESE